jgi:hypothetical protein
MKEKTNHRLHRFHCFILDADSFDCCSPDKDVRGQAGQVTQIYAEKNIATDSTPINTAFVWLGVLRQGFFSRSELLQNTIALSAKAFGLHNMKPRKRHRLSFVARGL